MLAKEIMTKDIEIIQSNDSVLLAAKKMKSMDIGAVPVFDGDRPVGMITDRDITIRVVAEQLSPLDTTVDEVMTREVYAVSEDADAVDAVKMMEQKQVRRLLAKNTQDRITGILSLGDVAVNLNNQLAGEALRAVSKPVGQFR